MVTEQLLLALSASYDYALYIIALLMSLICYVGGLTFIELELVGALHGLSCDCAVVFILAAIIEMAAVGGLLLLSFANLLSYLLTVSTVLT